MRTVSQRSIRLLGGSAVVLVDSITQVVPEDAGKIVISGSHGGTSAAFFAAQVPALLYAFNDAGIGKGRAGVQGLDLLQALGIAAIAIAHDSAAIGDAADMLDSGVISTVNQTAHALGARPAMKLSDLVSALS